ncbi:LOW QUALITY PROTEIN: E3 ubiquitin/ISG15 ligase TRIM25-like [Rhinophrynus dorsalis]
MASPDLREELKCSICREIYTDPVTLSCGHNFCQKCIVKTWDFQDDRDYFCPVCKQKFMNRPEVKKNLILCRIVELFESPPAVQEESGICCSYCIHAFVTASKACLHCEAFLCNGHLKTHKTSEEHVLTEPTTSLEDIKCSVHKKILEYYCCEDACCVCVSCFAFGHHKGHQVELLKEVSDRKKKTLRDVLEKLKSKREEAEKRVQGLQDHRRKVQEKASDITQRVTTLIRDIREQLEALEKRVLSEISGQEEQVSLQVSGLIQQLEIKKDELSIKIHHTEELCNSTDPLSVLQGWESDNTAFYSAEDEDEHLDRDDEEVLAVGGLDEDLMSVKLHRALADIVSEIKAKRGFYMLETPEILLDVSSAANDVAVSDDLRTAYWSKTSQHRQSDNKFENLQVLSIQNFFSGRLYWEVEASESGLWGVGMAYESIERKGDKSNIGYNKRSWGFCMHNGEHSVIHDSEEIELHQQPLCQRLGIFLDYEAGRLSFYQLCDPLRHLHTFTATFTEPLHAVFCVGDSGWIRIKS